MAQIRRRAHRVGGSRIAVSIVNLLPTGKPEFGAGRMRVREESGCISVDNFTETFAGTDGSNRYFTASNRCEYRVVGAFCFKRPSGGETCGPIGGDSNWSARMAFAYAGVTAGLFAGKQVASTDVCPHQAYAWGRGALAFQCHPEARTVALECWFIGHACEIAAAGLSVPHLRENSTLRAAARNPGRAVLRRVARDARIVNRAGAITIGKPNRFA